MNLLIKSLIIVEFAFQIILPVQTFAQTGVDFCDPNGVTVAVVNGVNNTKRKADDNRDALKKAYDKQFDTSKINFITLYNETHLGGIGDLLKTYLQRGADKEFTYVDDYDLRSLDIQLEKDLTTQKLLIVGHSQGTLYANALYETLSKVDGEMKVLGPLDESIGVYGIGVAATHMEKGNHYVTSDTDAVIKLSRTFMPGAPAPANIHIDESLFTGDNVDPADGGRGHGLVPIYLKYQSERIIGDISDIINGLKSFQSHSQAACVVTASRPIADYAKTNLFALADPIGASVVSVVTNSVSTTYYLVKQIGTVAYVAYHNTTDTLGTLLSGFFTNPQSLALGLGSQVAIVSLPTSSTNSSTKVSDVTTQTNAPAVVSISTKPVVLPKIVAPKKEEPQTVAMTITSPSATQPTQTIVPTIILPFVGAGGGGSSAPTVSPIVVEEATTTATTTDPVLPPEEPPTFTIDTPTQDSFDTDTITFSGTKTDGSDVVIEGVATTTSLGTAWQYTTVVPEGNTNLVFFAYKNGLISSSTEKTVNISIPDSIFTIPFINAPGGLATSSIIPGTKEKNSTLRVSWQAPGGPEIGFAFFGTSTQTKWSVDTGLLPGVYVVYYQYHGGVDGQGGGNFIYNPYYEPTDDTPLTFTPFLSGTLPSPLTIHLTHRKGYHVTYNFSDGTTIATSPLFTNETDIPITLPPGSYGYSFAVYDGANQVVQNGSTGFTLE